MSEVLKNTAKVVAAVFFVGLASLSIGSAQTPSMPCGTWSADICGKQCTDWWFFETCQDIRYATVDDLMPCDGTCAPPH